MADVPTQTELRKIRTFADDVKRAGGESALAATARPPLQAPAVAQAPLTASVQSKTARDMQKAVAGATDDAAFDIREEARAAVADATIIRDNRAKRWSLTGELSQGANSWMEEFSHAVETWSEKLKHALEPQRAAPAMVPDIAPAMRGVPSTVVTDTPPSTPTVASVAPTAWRNISEPRAEVPLPHATEAEARAFREKLVANLPKPESVVAHTFKAARTVRPITDTQRPLENAPAVHEEVLKPEERVMRDIPFIPPVYTRAQEATNLRTYRDDAITDVTEQHLSASQIASAELTRRAGMRSPIIITRPPSRTVPILIALGLMLTLGGGATLLYQMTANAPAAPIATSNAGFFKTDTTESVALTADRTALLSALAAARENVTLSAGQFVQWIIEAPLADTLAVLDPRAPGAFLRSLEGGLMFGAYGGQKAPYLVLKTASFETGFAGMLAWEDSLSADLAPFFGEPVRKSYEPGALTVDQTRPAYFQDRVVENRDVRLLVDEVGTERMVYTFIDETTIIIAKNTETLDAVARRLR